MAFERATDEYFKMIDSKGVLLCDGAQLGDDGRQQVTLTLQNAMENIQAWMTDKKLKTFVQELNTINQSLTSVLRLFEAGMASISKSDEGEYFQKFMDSLQEDDK